MIQPISPNLRLSTWHIATVLAMLLLSSCAMTGDPMEDSIFFSPRLAEGRLTQKHAELGQLRQQSEAEQIRSRVLKKNLSKERSTQQKNKNEISVLRKQIAEAEKAKAAAERDIAIAKNEGLIDQDAIRHRDAAQAEVNRLTQILHRLLETE